jgi:hypothetical protein
MSNDTILARIETAKKNGALVFMDKDWIEEKTPLYKLEMTELEISKDTDCFKISSKFMPKREIVDRIGEANGIDFLNGETKSEVLEDSMCGKRVVYTAFAQGRKMMPDGSYRTSSRCDYAFDPVLRAMLDYNVTEINEQTKQKRRTSENGNAYGSTLARYILELQKVAVQRANTGARLRVIRELVGIPTAFEEKELAKPLYFCRIVQNTDYILKTPEGRAMATAKALGVDISSMFGGRKTVLESPAARPDENPAPQNMETTAETAATEAAGYPDFEDETPNGAQTEFDRHTDVLKEYLAGYAAELNITTSSGKNPYKLAEAELASMEATGQSRKNMIDRLRKFLAAKGAMV